MADFYREAARADGDDALLQLIDPPPLLEVLGAICGGDELRCIHIQPRTVPPDGEGGYTRCAAAPPCARDTRTAHIDRRSLQ